MSTMQSASAEYTLSVEYSLFEFPLNERFRTYLRLEALYLRWKYLLSRTEDHDHHSAIMTLFEVHEFASRYDLKGDLLLETSRYKQSLNRLRDLPSLSEERLKFALMSLSDAQKQIEKSPKFGSTLPDNDWLSSVKSRIVVPGGICAFDGPFYYQWLKQPTEARRADLEAWFLPLMPLFEALTIILMMARDSYKRKSCITQDKTYQQLLNGIKFDLLQVLLPNNSSYIPDVSANKHVIWLRFSAPSFHGQLRRFSLESEKDEVTFDLSLCGLL